MHGILSGIYFTIRVFLTTEHAMNKNYREALKKAMGIRYLH